MERGEGHFVGIRKFLKIRALGFLCSNIQMKTKVSVKLGAMNFLQAQLLCQLHSGSRCEEFQFGQAVSDMLSDYQMKTEK